jgi:hypothetical protein
MEDELDTFFGWMCYVENRVIYIITWIQCAKGFFPQCYQPPAVVFSPCPVNTPPNSFVMCEEELGVIVE